VAEHWRPTGLSQGYFCYRCGAAGVNMAGTDHGPNHCEPNPMLVAKLVKLNTVAAQRRREFKEKLRG